jgi:hypothetical protein
MDIQGQQINSQQLTYEQFQEQVQKQRELERIQAQQAIRSAGLDRRSMQAHQIVIELQNIERELQLAENQLQTQMDAQKRQIQNIRQRLQQAEHSVKAAIAAAGSQTGQNTTTSGYFQ